MDRYQETFNKYNLDLDTKSIALKTKKIIDKMQGNFLPDVLRFIYSCIDLTSLNSDDSKEKIWAFVEKINNFEGSSDLNNVAAICVYPNFIKLVKETLTADVRIAAVAGGFPSSQTFIEVKMIETSLAIADGAEEIDVVINIGDFIDENYQEVVEELTEIREASVNAKLKVILETGLLNTPVNIRKASILAMYSGADFIKTSTGKIDKGASPEAVYVICDTIKEYYKLHKKRIGIKIAGGVKSPEDAVTYYTIVKEVLGNDWLTPEYFRIGASSLSENILNSL